MLPASELNGSPMLISETRLAIDVTSWPWKGKCWMAGIALVIIETIASASCPDDSRWRESWYLS